MDEADEFGDLCADLDEHVNAGFTTVSSSFDSAVKESKPNDCELNNRSDSLLDDADAALDLGYGVQSDNYTSESEDDLCIVLNENEQFDLRKREVGDKEEDFGIGNGLTQHERCRPVGNSSMLPYGRGGWDHFRFPYFGGLSDAVRNGFNFFLPRSWTIFDVNIEELDYKPWRRGGVNIRDYFNFDLDEDSWKSYCQDLDLLRDKAMMLNCMRHDRAAFIENEINKEPEKPKGRPIHVRSNFGERVPSTDIWRPPTERDSDVVININMTGSMEDENNLDTVELTNPEGEEGESNSTLMEHENEPTERCFDLHQDGTDSDLDTDSMPYSYYEREGRKTQIATVDLDSPSEGSIEERNFNRAHRSSKQKAKFQSTKCSSSRTRLDKKSKVLKPRKDRDCKNKNSIEECHDRYYKKQRSLRYHSRSFSIKEEQKDGFVRQVAAPSAQWHEKEDRPPFGIQRYWYMDAQNPRNPRPEMRGRYGHSTNGNINYNNGNYTGHLRSERHHFNRKENILSQKGHYRRNFVCGHPYTEDEFVLGTFEERHDERRYNWPVNRRFNSFQKGFVKRGSCYGDISRNLATNKPFMNGRRWYGDDWLDEGNSGMCAFVDTRERNYIANNHRERGWELLASKRNEAVNIRFGDDRKKLPRKDYEISCQEHSQHIKRSTNCTPDGKDQNPRISRFERRILYKAGSTNTISRVDGDNDSEQVRLTHKIEGEREKRFSEKILEAMDKMQKRRERFKESAFMKKEGEESEKKALREIEAGAVADGSKNLRPVRKRRWGCQ